MKVKHTLIILIAGFCFDVAGAFIKLLHLPYTGHVLIVAMVLMAAGALLFLYKMVTHPKVQSFLNW